MRLLAKILIVQLTIFAASTSVRAIAPPSPQDPFWKNAACSNPRLTRTAISKRATGHVSVLFDITAKGKVSNIRIADSQPEGLMDLNVKQALKRWRYFAYIKEGKEAARRNVAATFTFGPDQTDSCTHAPLPALPSTSGSATDPFVAIKICPTLIMPNRTKRQGKAGMVSLQYDVGANGEVLNVKVLESHPDNRFIEQAEKSLNRWKYSDFLNEGIPTPRPDLHVNFHFGDLPEGASNHRCAFAPWDATEKVIEIKTRERRVIKGPHANQN